MTKNKDNKRKAAGKAARAFFAGAALCALLGTALFSCSLFSADSGHSDFGSITMAMPSAEQINAARGSVSRAVTSSGAFDDDAVTAFKVRTKNAATGDENVQTVEPGSTVRISPLAPGFWSVTVFGNTSADQTVYYGKTQNILVSAGQNTPATVVINPVSPNTPLLISLQAAPSLPAQGRANVTGAYVSFDADGQTSSAYYDFSNADAAKQPQEANKIIVPVPAFLEPETSASANVWLFGSNGAALWSGTVSGDVKSDGTLEGELSFMDTSLVGTQIAGAVPPADYAKVESSLATQMENALSYSFDTRAAGAASAGDSKAYSDLKIKALVSDACGNVPVLAECSGAAWAAVIPFKHKYVEPTVTMPNQKIPLGATRTLSAVVTPKDSKEYSVCKAAQSYDAYGLKLYSIQAKDTGSTVSASSYAAPASPVSSEFTEPDKVKATSAAASDEYTWQVTVTKSDWAYFEGNDSQTEKTFSGTFDATGSAWTITPAEVSVEKGAAFTLTLKCSDATEADAKSVSKVTLAAGSSSKDFAPTASGTSLAVKAENFATWTGAKNVTVSVEGVDVGTVKVTATASSGGGGGGGGNVPPDPDWFSFQSSIAVQPEGTTGAADELYNICTYGAEGTKYAAPTPRYVLFGNYPRSHKDDTVTIDTDGESHVMGNFTYYKGSDGEWYAKFQTGRNSYYKYYAGPTPGAKGDAVESAGSVAWFKLEPIKWRVLTTNYNGTGKALLVPDEALPGYFDYYAESNPNHYSFAYVYNTDYSTPNRTVGTAPNEKTIYKNNYQYSDARAWLNGLDGSSYDMQDWTDAGFINSAFTEAGRMKIEDTEVDNSAAQCYYAFVDQGTDTKYDRYLSENTTDKVFLLSLNEVTNPLYGFYEYILQYGARCFIPTDLAIASNCSRDENGDYYFGCITLLRSPDDSDTGVRNCSGIGYAGNAESAYNDYNNYFAPAICVDLSVTGIGKVNEGNAAADSHGALPGKFTVDGNGKQVKFSQSNLWKNNTSSDYHFVSQQYYYCEKNKERGSTDKYNCDLLDYTDVTAAITSANIVESDINTWRMLSSDEWQYLFETRDGAANKFGVAKIVNCDGPKSAYMTGFVLLPDTWTTPPAGISFTPGWTSTDLPETTVNKYNSWEWKKLEEAGAVFLPACGSCRKDGSWSYTYSWSSKYRGLYWDAGHKLVNISKSEIGTNTTPDYDPYFASIRLVVDAN